MILQTANLTYSYTAESQLELPDLAIAAGESVLVMGPSGSGKSTLLNLIAGVQPLQQGQIELMGHSYTGLGGRSLDRLRATHLGIIFQTLNLIPYLDGYANATLGVRFSEARAARVESPQREIERIGKALGLNEDLLSRPATELSLGQQQRVAVIRALLGKPELIIADEPTSALDPVATQQFMSELLDSLDRSSQAVLMVSHNQDLIPLFDRVVEIKADV